MSALFVIKPWQVRERSARIGISGYHFDAFASGLVDNASDLWTSDALSIQRKDGHDGVALGQCIHHFDLRLWVRLGSYPVGAGLASPTEAHCLTVG
ncbi:hypothetical protein [Paraburkholderia pallida]|uniref:Uncharacterized protein n=1 Tax=Paraburkholderia pallida TaxID=2547399 RepID=A0A4V1B0Y4_9BURK|nr:hypothetical protein [Paraburkholderia pallida]QBR04383.1 hypothetical protein E1956_45690 [Paraburkholderia pallida]